MMMIIMKQIEEDNTTFCVFVQRRAIVSELFSVFYFPLSCRLSWQGTLGASRGSIKAAGGCNINGSRVRS